MVIWREESGSASCRGTGTRDACGVWRRIFPKSRTRPHRTGPDRTGQERTGRDITERSGFLESGAEAGKTRSTRHTPQGVVGSACARTPLEPSQAGCPSTTDSARYVTSPGPKRARATLRVRMRKRLPRCSGLRRSGPGPRRALGSPPLPPPNPPLTRSSRRGPKQPQSHGGATRARSRGGAGAVRRRSFRTRAAPLGCRRDFPARIFAGGGEANAGGGKYRAPTVSPAQLGLAPNTGSSDKNLI